MRFICGVIGATTRDVLRVDLGSETLGLEPFFREIII